MELAASSSAPILVPFVTKSLSTKLQNYQPKITQVFEEEEEEEQEPTSNTISFNSSSSMSQDYHHHHHHQAAAASAGIFGAFSNGFDRTQQEQQHMMAAQQIRRDHEKLRVQAAAGFEPPPPLVAIDEEEESTGYETAGMLSEMFNYPHGATSATELLEHQISANYHHRNSTTRQQVPAGIGHDNWYVNNNRQSGVSSDHHQQQHHIETSINASDQSAAAAMQLFLMNPSSSARSPSPSPPTNSTLHMLLPNPNPSPSNSTSHHHQDFQTHGGAFGPSSHHQQFTWVPATTTSTTHDQAGGASTTHDQLHPHHILQAHGAHGQGLSLSLSSSLQHLEAAKAEEFRMGDGTSGMLFFNQGGTGSTNGNSGPQFSYKANLGTQHHQALHLQGGVVGGANHPVHVGFGSSSLGVVNVLRTSKYVKAAQELLEEFCSVGRGHFKKNKFGKIPNSSTNPNSTNPTGSTSGGGGGSSSSSKDQPPLSAADRIEHQRRKVKLLSMLDEARNLSLFSFFFFCSLSWVN